MIIGRLVSGVLIGLIDRKLFRFKYKLTKVVNEKLENMSV